MPDKILLGWFLLMSIHQLFYYFDHSKYLYSITFLIGLDFPFPLMHGPFLFLYASALVGNLPARKIVWLIHFLPAAICYLYLTEFYFLPAEKKLFVIANQGIGYETFLKIKYPAILLSGVAYVFMTLILLNTYQKKIKDNYSDIEKINLEWLRYLTYGIGFIWLTVFFGTEEHTFIAVVIFVMVIGFFGIKQTPVFTKNNSPEGISVPGELVQMHEIENAALIETAVSSIPEKGKYQKSALNEYELQEIHRQLSGLMKIEKSFTNSELTLGDLAQRLEIHPNHLSQVINSVVNKNFYDYINSQRVEEFTRLVKEPESKKFTLLSLAYECGFNSKTSFNRNFRKTTGLSPSQYLKQINVDIDPGNEGSL